MLYTVYSLAQDQPKTRVADLGKNISRCFYEVEIKVTLNDLNVNTVVAAKRGCQKIKPGHRT